jgi:YD repeat-containing protein
LPTGSEPSSSITSIASSGDVLAQTYDALGRLTSVSRSGISITTFTYNADGTAASRSDRAPDNTTYTSTNTYTNLGQLASATLPGGFGSAAYTWGLDGNLTTRTWGSAITGTYRYDGAKRPISLTIHRAGQGADDTLTRTYDLAGNALSESRTFGGVTGLAGASTQSLVYDDAGRLTESYFGPSDNKVKRRLYEYDANSNRTKASESGIDFYYFYDATDELTRKSPTSDPNGSGSVGFSYDSLGQMTTSQPSGPDSSVITATTYGYDPAGRLASINAGQANAVTFALDAWGATPARR